MRKPALLLLAVVPLYCTPSFAMQQDAPKATPADPTGDPMLTSAGFLSSHPDLRYRLLGLDEYKKKNYKEAFRFFQRASHYADKPSQGMVAEMLWIGQGVEQDRALAYAWMDLASERGYRSFLALRERYWNELQITDRGRALAEGQDIYEKYGDAVAKPRIAATLRRERRATTGSRTGFVGSLKIVVPGPSGEETIDGSKFYDPKYWEPEKYHAWHDSIWMTPRIGKVSVGEMERVNEASPLSRVPKTDPEATYQEPINPENAENRADP